MLKVFVGRMKSKPLFMPFWFTWSDGLYDVLCFRIKLSTRVFTWTIDAQNNNVGLCFHSTRVLVYHYFVHFTILLCLGVTITYLYLEFETCIGILLRPCKGWLWFENFRLFLAVSPLFWWYFLIAEFPPLTLLNVL